MAKRVRKIVHPGGGRAPYPIDTFTGSEPKDARHYEPENMPEKVGTVGGVARGNVSDIRIANPVDQDRPKRKLRKRK